ncbi:tetratricopeptide repeat protein [Jatrophihabitans fulvus]
MSGSWDDRVAAVWASADERDEDAVVADVRALVDERPDDAAARFEWASALDFAGREGEAEPEYRAALASPDLDADRRGQATVQLASTLRNLGRPDEALALLTDVPGLPDAITAFRALALVDLDRPRDAVRELLPALAPHLPRYAGSVRYYAGALPADAVLRPVADEDALGAVVAAAADADPDDVTPPLGDGWTDARLDWLRTYHRKRFTGLLGPTAEGTWAIGDEAVLGVVRLRHLGDGRFETGLWLVRAARGRGLGRAAVHAAVRLVRSLGGREIVADTTPQNAAAVALLRRLGFDLRPGPDGVAATLVLR